MVQLLNSHRCSLGTQQEPLHCPAVLAIDLLGFGASAKPREATYNPHLWRDQVTHFIQEHCKPEDDVVLVGNSIGSQVSHDWHKQVCIQSCLAPLCAVFGAAGQGSGQAQPKNAWMAHPCASIMPLPCSALWTLTGSAERQLKPRECMLSKLPKREAASTMQSCALPGAGLLVRGSHQA